MREVIFVVICNSCGANMRFDPELQQLKCDYCGKSIACSDENKIQHINALVEDLKKCQTVFDEYYEANLFKCPQCGARLITTDETLATFCSYCGSSVMIKERVSKQKKPDCLVPFSISKEKCEEIYKKTLKKAWFAPRKMKKGYNIEKIRGIYMPYWIYDFEGKKDLKFKVEQSWRSGDYIYTQHYDASADTEFEYNGIAFDSSSNFYDDISQSISDYNMKDAKEFKVEYLSGFYVDVGNVPFEIYEDNAVMVMIENIKEMLKKNEKCIKYKCDFSDLRTGIKHQRLKMGYFPVWFMAINSSDNKRTSYVAINGSTGKIAAEIPIDMKRFFGAVILVSFIIFLILNTFLLITPIEMILSSIVLNGIGLIILNKNYNEIQKKDTQIEDEGVRFGRYLRKEKFKYKLSWKEKLKLCPSIIAILLSIVILFLNLAADEYYYSIGIISYILFGISAFNIIKLRNLLASRKLPQFKKRGGDADA